MQSVTKSKRPPAGQPIGGQFAFHDRGDAYRAFDVPASVTAERSIDVICMGAGHTVNDKPTTRSCHHLT